MSLPIEIMEDSTDHVLHIVRIEVVSRNGKCFEH